MAIYTFTGELEIDTDRGVIYFHSYKGMSLLRICRLPTPIPEPLMTFKLSEDHSKFEVADYKLLDVCFNPPIVSWRPRLMHCQEQVQPTEKLKDLGEII